jgi:hypothetical protein
LVFVSLRETHFPLAEREEHTSLAKYSSPVTVSESPVTNASGKLLIIGILTVALAAAGISWWFRYNATHLAANFWGPTAARLIRDAPMVTLTDQRQSAANWRKGDNTEVVVDMSATRGLTHLRSALLDNRSFIWDEKLPEFTPIAGWVLRFQDPATNEEAAIVFFHDCKHAALAGGTGPQWRPISCEPIAAGLHEIFTENLPQPAPAR